MARIVAATNMYSQTTDDRTGKRKCGPRWKNLTVVEFRNFLGIVILMSQKKLPALRDYWKVSYPDYYDPLIVSRMSWDPFEAILRCLSRVDKDTVVTDRSSPQFDPLAKCRWLYESMTTNWQKMHNSNEWLCVNECMVPYAGRYCLFKQYISSKPTRYGIKVWALCLSNMKYMYNCEVYVGANVSLDTEGEPRLERSVALGSGYGVVMRLTGLKEPLPLRSNGQFVHIPSPL